MGLIVFLVLMNALVWWSVWNEKREEYNHHSFPRELFVDLVWGLWSVGTYFLPQICKCEYTYSDLGKEKSFFCHWSEKFRLFRITFAFFSRFFKWKFEILIWVLFLFLYTKSLYISHMYCLSWKPFTLLYFIPEFVILFFLYLF